jgi:hypothetical protein
MKSQDAVFSVAMGWLAGSLEHLGRSRVLVAVGAIGMAFAACTSGGGNAEPTATHAAALISDEWKGGFGEWPFHGPITTDPAVCSNHPTYFFVAGLDDSDKKYYVNWQLHPASGTTWTAFGTRQFSSAPSCVFEKPFRFSNPPTDFKFVLAGKGTDNRIYAVPGHQPVTTPMQNPTWDGAWAEAKTSTETSPTYAGNYGRPAIGSNGNLIALVFLNSDRKVHARTHATPFANNGWSALKDGPALPAGVTSDGIPAITYDRGPNSRPINKFVVAVLGVSNGSAGIYWIYFDGNAWGSWNQAFLTEPVLSDPALEYDDQSNALSLYFKTDTGTILSTSSVQPEDFGVDPIEPVGTTGPSGSVSAPRAVFGAGFELGLRTVVTRGWAFTPSNSTILWVEDDHRSPFEPYETTPGQGPACSDASNPTGGVLEHFGSNANNNIIGCPGNVAWSDRALLCGAGSRPCTAAEFVAQRGTAIPTHDYWTDDNLRYSGSGTNACSVSKTVGTACPTGQPMRVCSASGTDAESNQCNWTECGYGSNTPNQYFGGCAGNTTAGTLCCLAVQ